MSIAEKIEKGYKNQIEMIKSETDYKRKQKLVGALVGDLGPNSMNAVARTIGSCWRYVKKCNQLFIDNIEVEKKEETRGRKKLTQNYPDLINDIENIISTYLSIKTELKDETQYVKLSIKEIKQQLIKTGKYTDSSFSDSSLNNIVNQIGYKLKKVKKTKPLKKIKETDEIFLNVHERKDKAMKDENTILISIDTKDKVLLGPYSRNGKNRIQIEACDHNLTNDCLIPFGILDMKKNTPYFFNFTSKPTSLDMIDCIEEFYQEQYAGSNKTKIAILLDNGPDNSGVRTIFLKGLIEFCKRNKIEIELIYYPPYHSKYNPIERLWARIENIWNGFLLETVDICLNFMRNLTWKNVKSVTKLKDVKYEKGLTVNKKDMEILENNHIIRSEGIKKWSLVITP